MNYVQAHQALLDGQVDGTHAHELLDLAQSYGGVTISNLREGNDSWGSHIKLSVSWGGGWDNGFKVEFAEIKHY